MSNDCDYDERGGCYYNAHAKGVSICLDHPPSAMRYQHDCPKCRSLGSWREFDLYCCENDGGTVLARYGDDGPDYSSGRELAHMIPALAVAEERAIKCGLLS